MAWRRLKMQGQEGKYNIKAVSKIVGIQPGTLRAWERRYQMIAPIRNELGYRLYTDEHIKILKWLIKKVNLGFTIGQAVSLLETNQLNPDVGEPLEGNQQTSLLDNLLDAFIHFNESKAHEIINTLFTLFTVEKVIFEIFGTLLIKVGDLWESRRITSAHEHFTTSIIRSRIETIFYNNPQNSLLPKVITVCTPGETHDIGLLMFSLFLRRKGYEVIYIGESITVEDIDAVVKITNPDIFFVSCTMQENLTSALSLLTQFSLNYQNLQIGIGGRAVNTMKKSDRQQFSDFIVGQLPAEWERWLKKTIRME